MLCKRFRDIGTAVLAIAASTTVPLFTLAAQTPEQRYTDWARPGFRPQEYEYRRGRIMDGLRATGGGLLLVPSADGITHGGTFRQLDDFWYLTGLEVPGSMLVLDADQGVSLLFMPPRDPRFENPGRPNDFPGRPLLDGDLVILDVGCEIDHEEPYMQTASFFGHHIGLSVGDPALLDEPLASGMVFTVEPWYNNPTTSPNTATASSS